jgi:hypothetical protein
MHIYAQKHKMDKTNKVVTSFTISEFNSLTPSISMPTETRNLTFQHRIVTQAHFFTFCLLMHYTLAYSLLATQIP